VPNEPSASSNRRRQVRLAYPPAPRRARPAELKLVGSVDDRRVALRGAIFDADGRRVVVAVSKGLWDELLQLAGDGLLLALAQGVQGAPDLARRCAEQLRERSWEGDDDLADQLDAALGDRPAPMLRPLLVDLEELARRARGLVHVLRGAPTRPRPSLARRCGVLSSRAGAAHRPMTCPVGALRWMPWRS